MKKYTIKSVSNEGVFYLVKGWYKEKAIWFSEKRVMANPSYYREKFFSTPASAKATLTKLLKVMPEYETDVFEVVEF